MRILITGAAGMLGRKLTARLLTDGVLRGEAIAALDLVDVSPVDVTPRRTEAPARTGDDGAPTIRTHVVDLAAGDDGIDTVLAARPDVVFHLAGVVSGEAERDLAKGYRVNLDGTRRLFDAVAALDTAPRVVFTSSIAVFGAPLPDPVTDDYHLTPLTSYGTQKAIGEAILADYTRRGLVDGVGIRLPTITVRPGRPNAAASGFFSGIIREPLAGQRAVLPVPTSVRHPHASPRAAVGFLMHAAQLDSASLGGRPNLTMPSVSVTVAEQIAALERAAGPEVSALIDHRPDPEIATIVEGWPRRFVTTRADELGFVADSTYDAIIDAYLADDGPADDGPADDGPADDGPADDRPADDRPGYRDPTS